MFQSYLTNINHNCYLKINNKNAYNYAKLNNLKLIVKFKKDLNNKFLILSIFFLFKQILFKNGYYILLNKKTKKIIGMKFILRNNLMFLFLNFLVLNFLNQPEIQNNINLKSFDLQGNYMLGLSTNSYYYFEKYLCNTNFKNTLNYFNIYISFNFNNNDLINHIFYLNLFKFYFLDLNK